MKSRLVNIVISWALLVHHSMAIRIAETDDALTLARTAFNGPMVAVLSASYAGNATSSGTFTVGPFEIGNEVILTTGRAKNPSWQRRPDEQWATRFTLVLQRAMNGAALTVSIFIGRLSTDYASSSFSRRQTSTAPDFRRATYRSSYILRDSLLGDNTGIWLDVAYISRDGNGITIYTNSHLLEGYSYIGRPASITSYYLSSPPLLFEVFASTVHIEWSSPCAIEPIGDMTLVSWSTGEVGPRTSTYKSTIKASSFHNNREHSIEELTTTARVTTSPNISTNDSTPTTDAGTTTSAIDSITSIITSSSVDAAPTNSTTQDTTTGDTVAVALSSPRTSASQLRDFRSMEVIPAADTLANLPLYCPHRSDLSFSLVPAQTLPEDSSFTAIGPEQKDTSIVNFPIPFPTRRKGYVP
ncbi:hypothetical protein FDECE_9297 [Fusarium decemcellulare]|nr:hypothetical protein FDECE_9297 [Fusarium decemcellulare]